MKYYSLTRILKQNAEYNVIFGERSNGKTYACLTYILQRYIKSKEQGAYLRRWKDDITGRRAASLFDSHTSNGLITKLTGGKYNEVFYLSGRWFLSYYNTETTKRTLDERPFCYAFALSDVEHDKSTSHPDITSIVFDEFLTRRYYLTNEFVIFMNVLSTIIRNREDVKVFMLGNTVNKYCPYFQELGLKNISKMSLGALDVYQFGKDGVRIAVEYTPTMEKQKKSNKYFAFDNSQLEMITGGKWELSVYPHLPHKYTPKDILLYFFIEFQEVLLQGELISTGYESFIYIHEKTTPLKDGVITYSLTASASPYVKRRLLSTVTRTDKLITKYFATDKVFYQNNEVGEVVRNYILTSMKNNLASL